MLTAKDHPALIAEVAEQWLVNTNNNRKRLVKHGCRTLIKNGNKRVLSAFGFKPAKLKQVNLNLNDTSLIFGGSIHLELSLTSAVDYEQNINIDYYNRESKSQW